MKLTLRDLFWLVLSAGLVLSCVSSSVGLTRERHWRVEWQNRAEDLARRMRAAGGQVIFIEDLRGEDFEMVVVEPEPNIQLTDEAKFPRANAKDSP